MWVFRQLLRQLLRANRIADVEPLATLTSLGNLDLEANRIADVGPLANLTSLGNLDLRTNQITDVESLANLTRLQELDLSDNPLSTQALTEQIPALQAKGVEVSY